MIFRSGILRASAAITMTNLTYSGQYRTDIQIS